VRAPLSLPQQVDEEFSRRLEDCKVDIGKQAKIIEDKNIRQTLGSIWAAVEVVRVGGKRKYNDDAKLDELRSIIRDARKELSRRIDQCKEAITRSSSRVDEEQVTSDMYTRGIGLEERAEGIKSMIDNLSRRNAVLVGAINDISQKHKNVTFEANLKYEKQGREKTEAANRDLIIQVGMACADDHIRELSTVVDHYRRHHEDLKQRWLQGGFGPSQVEQKIQELENTYFELLLNV